MDKNRDILTIMFGSKKRELIAEARRSEEEKVEYRILNSTDRRKFKGELYHRLVEAEIPWGYVVERRYLQDEGDEKPDVLDADSMRKTFLYGDGAQDQKAKLSVRDNYEILQDKESARNKADEYWKEALNREARHIEERLDRSGL